MTLPKGQCKISIKKRTDLRLQGILKRMIQEEPDKYDKNTSYNEVVSWLIDNANSSKSN